VIYLTEKISVSVLLEHDTYNTITDLQKKHGVFSRSALLRDIIDKGLGVVDRELTKNAK
jgi:metal-responsive CopG/Arc/MetJ family transcriptional regulator